MFIEVQFKDGPSPLAFWLGTPSVPVLQSLLLIAIMLHSLWFDKLIPSSRFLGLWWIHWSCCQPASWTKSQSSNQSSGDRPHGQHNSPQIPRHRDPTEAEYLRGRHDSTFPFPRCQVSRPQGLFIQTCFHSARFFSVPLIVLDAGCLLGIWHPEGPSPNAKIALCWLCCGRSSSVSNLAVLGGPDHVPNLWHGLNSITAVMSRVGVLRSPGI